LQSIISEEDGIELDDMAFQVIAKLEHPDDESTHDGTEYPYKHAKKERWFGWMWVCIPVLFAQ